MKERKHFLFLFLIINELISLRPYWKTKQDALNDQSPERTLSRIKTGICKQQIGLKRILGGMEFDSSGIIIEKVIFYHFFIYFLIPINKESFVETIGNFNTHKFSFS